MASLGLNFNFFFFYFFLLSYNNWIVFLLSYNVILLYFYYFVTFYEPKEATVYFMRANVFPKYRGNVYLLCKRWTHNTDHLTIKYVVNKLNIYS